MRTALWIGILVAVVAACAAEEPLVATSASSTEEIVIGPIGGGQCGSRVCGAGSFCCNASCGV